MDVTAAEDEKKPFEDVAHEEETMPDPDEELLVDAGVGRVWMVKIPKYLMERWSQVRAEGVHLATIRVYNEATSSTGKKPRIVLFLPPNSDPSNPMTPPLDPKRPAFASHTNYTTTTPGAAEPDTYELEIINNDVENQIVIAEHVKGPPQPNPLTGHQPQHNPRARTTMLTGRIKHDCNLRPVFSESYRRQMRERSRKYNTPQRQIRMIEDAGIAGGRGGVNRLSSGVGVGAGSAFGDLIKQRPKPAKGAFERMARMPRNQLLDLLFSLFRDTPRWGIKLLRERTQQPEAYLKEVLGEIAALHRSGEHNGLWELRSDFKEEGVKGEGDAGPSLSGGDVKMEGADDDDDDGDDDDDEDMEEIS